MNEVLNDKFLNFSKALKRLKEGMNEVGHSLVVDGILQRFEFTFEMAWKALKKFLFIDGYDCTSPRECIKRVFRVNI